MILSVHFLRFICAFSVVIYHASYKVDIHPLFKLGEIGVDVFFLISGFVIYLSTEDRSKGLKSFVLGRITRIYPLYFILTMIALIGYILFPSLVNSGRESAVVESFLLIPSDKPHLIGVAWTLIYEMMFYLVFLLSMKINHKYRGIICSYFLFILWGSRLVVDDPSQNLFYYFYSDAIILEFSVGILVANFYAKKSSWLYRCIFFVSLIVFYYCVYLIEPDHRLITFGGAALLIFTLFMFLEKLVKYISSYCKNKMYILGAISYSVYLTHPFVLSALNKIVDDDEYKLTLMFFGSFICSIACYYMVEKKLNDRFKFG